WRLQQRFYEREGVVSIAIWNNTPICIHSNYTSCLETSPTRFTSIGTNESTESSISHCFAFLLRNTIFVSSITCSPSSSLHSKEETRNKMIHPKYGKCSL
ncbi:hypothetical protein WA171_003895, partial [Blastocystis sp. BT1]